MTNSATIYSALRNLQLSRSQAQSLLPEWWSDAAAEDPGGLWELALLLSRRLGLSAQALVAGNVQTETDLSRVLFKRTARVPREAITVATLIASALARVTNAAIRIPYRPLSGNPISLREELLAAARNGVTLDLLCELAWSHGIPVLPVSGVPRGLSRMDGMISFERGRPVIVLARKQESRAWMAFILAHEIGHLALGHLRDGTALVDAEFGNADEVESDPAETAASEYAVKLLAGNAPPFRPSSGRRLVTAAALAAETTAHAKKHRIDRSHVILRHGFESGSWPVALDALRYFPEDSGASEAIRKAAKKYLHVDELAEDNAEYLRSMLGLG